MRTNGQALHRLDGTADQPVTALPIDDALSIAAAVDDTDTPHDVLDLLVLAGFTTGREPYAHRALLENVRADARLLPDGSRVARQALEDGLRTVLAVGDGWTLVAQYSANSRRATVTATAVSAELAESVVRRATEGAEAEPPPPDGTVPIGFWHLTGGGPPRRNVRRIAAAEWAEIRGNYSARVGRALDDLMALTPDSLRGRLILLHGPPGTGKTTLMRVLARQWRSWCQVDCVLDPEVLFSNPAYLMDVALGVDDGKGERWRLLLLEDCDELISGEAKRATGQALSRLLNLTDGIVGQGRKVLIAITTNEDMAALHPAISRPGRCLARIEVGPLPVDEAAAWLAAHGLAAGRGSATLAELYALRDGTALVESSEPVPSHGLYL